MQQGFDIAAQPRSRRDFVFRGAERRKKQRQAKDGDNAIADPVHKPALNYYIGTQVRPVQELLVVVQLGIFGGGSAGLQSCETSGY
ncbi:MAG TPA: hypothetical protein VFB04_14100 [Terriglobales bacterium]|nr:hypothetical protein [Terriglobales bacterium]